VLSPSTEDYDRGDKLDHYKRIDSLREVMLVAHDRILIEIWRRTATATWVRQDCGPGSAMKLEAVPTEIPVDELYGDVRVGA